MEKNANYLYFDLRKSERDAVIGFLLNTLLQARKECSFPSNEKGFDEDVNIYLAHLLFASSLPDYQELTNRYLSLNTSDLAELVGQTPDKVVRYFIYKVNADYLLIHLGIFHDLAGNSSKLFKRNERQWMELAQSYYDSASQYNHQIYRKQTAVGHVLGKLSNRFNDYKKILEFVGDDFFHFVKEMNRLDLYQQDTRMNDRVQKAIDRLQLDQKQDEFLDLYGEWLNTKSEATKIRLIQLAEEIKKLNPAFGFDEKKFDEKRLP